MGPGSLWISALTSAKASRVECAPSPHGALRLGNRRQRPAVDL
jgi:hypothetical protein